MARYKEKHYSANKDKHRAAVEKSKKTVLKKFGVEGYSEFRRHTTKKTYELETEKLNKANIVSKQDVLQFLKEYEPNYFKGRAGNRTMKSINLSVYKSLIHYTNEFSVFYNNRPIPFSGRVDIAFKNFTLTKDDLCYCGSRIKFDPKKQLWSKQYCMVCKLTGVLTSPDRGKEWLPEWTKEWETKWKPRMVQSNCIMRGENESKLLDKMEVDESIAIDRNFKVLRYMPDGYCSENNTVYEVYERHHKYTAHTQYDKTRQQIIQDYLKCNFCIIWDDDSNKVEYFKYV
jgi:hypothetical protein